MEKIRKLLIILISLAVLISIMLVLLRSNKDNNKSIENINYGELYGVTDMPLDENLHRETNIISLYTMQNIIRQYIQFVEDNNIEAINDISFNNNLDYTKINCSSDNYYIQDGYASQNINNSVYYVYGISANELGDIDDNYFKIYIDHNKETFAIEDSSNKEFENAKNKLASKTKENTIDSNNYNKYKNLSLDTNERVQIYLDDFIFKVNNNLEMAYNLLQDEYKNNKFKTFSDFALYVEENKEKLEDFVVYDVGYNYIEEHLQYRCTSTSQLVYIIDVYGGFDYKIQLDSYTIEDNNWKENYNNSKDEEKITLIINKVIDILNQHDYSTLYKMINKEFKQNNFPTEQSFEEYIKTHFFETNVLTKLSIEENSGIYICNCVIKESNRVASDKVTQQFMVLLEEGTDFDISFKIK